MEIALVVGVKFRARLKASATCATWDFSCWGRARLTAFFYLLSVLCNLVFQLLSSSSAHCIVFLWNRFWGRFFDWKRLSLNSRAVMASEDGILSQVVVDKMSLEECRSCFDAAANSTDSGVSAFTINICAMSVYWHHSPTATVFQFLNVFAVNRSVKSMQKL